MVIFNSLTQKNQIMKRILLNVFMIAITVSVYSCRETTQEKTEEAVEAMGEDIENAAEEAGDAIQEGADELNDEIQGNDDVMDDDA